MPSSLALSQFSTLLSHAWLAAREDDAGMDVESLQVEFSHYDWTWRRRMVMKPAEWMWISRSLPLSISLRDYGEEYTTCAVVRDDGLLTNLRSPQYDMFLWHRYPFDFCFSSRRWCTIVTSSHRPKWDHYPLKYAFFMCLSFVTIPCFVSMPEGVMWDELKNINRMMVWRTRLRGWYIADEFMTSLYCIQ